MKRLGSIAVLVCLVVPLLTTGSVAVARPSKGTVYGRVTGRIVIPGSPELDRALRGKDLSRVGLIKENGDYVAPVIFRNATVVVGGRRVRTDDNGVYRVDSVDSGKTAVRVNGVDGGLIAASGVQVRANTRVRNDVSLCYSVDASAACRPTAGSAQGSLLDALFPAAETAYAVHPCKDWNGPWGNYRDNQSGWQKYQNFIGSDCYYAMSSGHCWQELMPGCSCVHWYLRWNG